MPTEKISKSLQDYIDNPSDLDLVININKETKDYIESSEDLSRHHETVTRMGARVKSSFEPPSYLYELHTSQLHPLYLNA